MEKKINESGRFDTLQRFLCQAQTQAIAALCGLAVVVVVEVAAAGAGGAIERLSVVCFQQLG